MSRPAMSIVLTLYLIALAACAKETTTTPSTMPTTATITVAALATVAETSTRVPSPVPSATPVSTAAVTWTATASPTATPTCTATVTVTPTMVSTATPTVIPTIEDPDIPSTEWSGEAHTKDAAPNYAVVFPRDRVNRLTITIAPADWQALLANLVMLLGEPGTAGGQAVLPAPACTVDGQVSVTEQNPIWVPATVAFNGQTWEHVGVRFRGNMSLQSAWQSGSLRLPLKLDFDEFEDAFPEIKNQRFYGFKQLILANDIGDPSHLRDTVADDLLQRAGLIAPETAPYRVVIDYGEGPVVLGLYTAIEVIDDSVITHYLGSDDGNIYQAEGAGASLREGTRDQIRASFQKENNEDAADWSDIERLYDVLHAPTRFSDPPAWRAELEAVFDVHTFLRWLAMASMLQHWDTYGCVPHNYYLYHDPSTDRLVWISWDHNQVLTGGLGGEASRALSRSEVTVDWPLVRYLLDDPVYAEEYAADLTEIVPLFDPAQMAGAYQEEAALLAPRAPMGEGALLVAGIEALEAQARVQYNAGLDYITAH